jgi:hypothetical protein
VKFSKESIGGMENEEKLHISFCASSINESHQGCLHIDGLHVDGIVLLHNEDVLVICYLYVLFECVVCVCIL